MTDDKLRPVRRKLLDEDEWHDLNHDVARNEAEDLQQICMLWEAVMKLRKDLEKVGR